ncbi:MAG: hypothetical protein GQ547_05290 [Methylophaga sp.]|nr:hypothetical protein [Methylophaga sp.]
MHIHATTASPPLGTTPTIRVNSIANNNDETVELSEQDLQQIQELKSRDQLVRAHESAHIAAGSGITRGGANFSFQRGPDGVQYAIGGEVKIDASKVAGDPEATLQKAEQIQAAALAPTQPSTQDRNVAAKAAQMAVEARAEINQQATSTETSQTTIISFVEKEAEELTGNLLDLTT